MNDIFNFKLEYYYLGSIPLGLSFITFTIIAYLIDIRKNFEIPHTNIDCLNYIFFFPQLLAGPILRPSELLIQLKTKFKFDTSKISLGIGIFSIGMIKKVIFADTIGEIVDPTFASIDAASSFDLWIAFFLFPQQIYFDFSGYTHMAIGLAYILNIELPENFNSPYLTTSITNFWKSWHMTLSRWIRDYIFIPLGGSRVNFSRNILNILIAMTLSGLWHGANYTFIVWGFLNGFIICLEKFLKIRDDTVYIKYILIFLNLFFIFNLWVIFRAESLFDIFNFYIKMYQFNLITNYLNFILLIVVSLILIFFQKYDKTQFFIKFFSKNVKIKLTISITLVFLCLFLTGGQSQKFIYFDF
ncbi:MBOAT family protein [Candidatus Pelagibacter ubique]|uniref:MBOAT family O-acyltransferase n=1 Tax=Pelagibacter ubique TaxID=198252 RepID=UPI0018AD39D6